MLFTQYMNADNLYDTLHNIQLLRESFSSVSTPPRHQSISTEEFVNQGHTYANNLEKNALVSAMTISAHLPHPNYTQGFCLKEQLGASDQRDDWLREDRKEITDLIGEFQIRNNTLSESASKRADYISKRILEHFS